MSKELLHKAIGKWGIESQINKIQEEALELALAIINRKCTTKDQSKVSDNIIDDFSTLMQR